MLSDGLRFLEGAINTNLVLPVATATQKAALTPNMGEVVFQSDGTKGLYVYDGTQWVLGFDASAASSPIDATKLPAFTGDVTSTAGTSVLTLGASGVTAGTYKSVTVNAKGLVTAGTNPTTIAGYGITDAYTKTEVNTAISNATPTLSFDTLTGKPTTLAGYGITDAITSADVNLALSAAVVKNADIVAGTAAKITYDAKGLVTAGSALTESDIPVLSTDKLTSGVLDIARLPSNLVYTVGGALPSGLVPSISLTGTITPNTYADMAAVVSTSATGTVAIVTADSDLTKNGTYVKATDGTWKKLNVGTNSVNSINGKNGNIAKILPEDISGVFDSNGFVLSTVLPLFAGDVVSTSGARNTLTLNTIPGLTVGSYSSVTVNAKGLVTGGVVGTNYTSTQADAKFVSKTVAGEKNAANGYLGLDATGKIAATYLPVFDGDVVSTSGARSTLSLKTINGLVAGSYSSVTVNTKGLVTGGVIGENYTKIEADAKYSTKTESDAKYLTKAISGGRNVAEGFVGLNASAKIDSTYLPAITVNSVKSVTTIAARDALTGVAVGDIAIVGGSVNKTYIVSSLSPKTWVEMLNPTGGVTSINGNTGVVTIDLSNIPGTLTVAKMPVYTTGDVITNAVSKDLELQTINGLTAGTYKSVTINAKGLVTAATNPTTLVGYGITDAYTKTEVDTAISNATPVLTFTSLTGKPTTLDGYGITDAVSSTDVRLTDSRTPLSHVHAITDITDLQASLDAKATSADINTAITALKANVDTSGDNLKKLYDLIVAGFKEITVANIAARDAYNVVSLPTNIFVTEDVSGKWALYKATATGAGGAFVKLSDPDLLNAAVGFTPENVVNKSIDGTLADNSDLLYPSQKAVKTYADTKVTKNTAITAGTGTKITYDAKGLVTGSTSLVESDLPNNLVYTTAGKIASSLLPAMVVTNTTVVNNPAADATNIDTYVTGAVKGDVAILANLSKTFILASTSPNVWAELLSPTAGVVSVNDLTGSAVNLSYTNIDAKSNDVVTAGSYNNVTVNTKGRITAVNNVTYSTPTDITTAIDNLKASVPTAGDNLKKLYDLVVASFKEVTVANIAARNAYNVTALPTNVFVTDDGDGHWALYKATTTGVGATFVKLSDPDLLNASVGVTPENVTNKSTDGTLADNSDIKYPSQKAVKTYADTKVAKNTAIVAGTSTKITYDANGLVTAGASLVEADLPSLTISKITNLQTSLDAKLAKNTAIVAGTATKITYDANGLVTTGASLTSSDLPNNLVYTTDGVITNAVLPAFSGDITSVAGSNVLSLTTSGVTAGTYNSVTVNAKGIVTAASNQAGSKDLSSSRTISLSENLMLTDDSKHIQIITATVPSLDVILPDATNYPVGGIHFVIKNNGYFTFNVADRMGNWVCEVSPSSSVAVLLSDNTKNTYSYTENSVAKVGHAGEWVTVIGNTTRPSRLLIGDETRLVASTIDNIAASPLTQSSAAVSYVTNNVAYVTIVSNSNFSNTNSTPLLIGAVSNSKIQIKSLNSTTILLTYQTVAGLKVSKITYDGTTLTVASTVVVYNNTAVEHKLIKLSNTSVLASYIDSANSLKLVTIDDQLALGTVNTFGTIGNDFDITWNNDKLLLVYLDTVLKTAVGTISAGTISFGTSSNVTSYAVSNIHVINTGVNTTLVAFYHNTGFVEYVALSIDNYTINNVATDVVFIGDIVKLKGAFVSDISLTSTFNKNVVLTYKTNNGKLEIVDITINSNSVVVNNTRTLINSNGGTTEVIALYEDSILCFYSGLYDFLYVV